LPGNILELVLEILIDEQWHDMEEIARRTGVSPWKMQIMTDFLAKYHLIRQSTKKPRVKISHRFAEFLRAIPPFDTKKKPVRVTKGR